MAERERVRRPNRQQLLRRVEASTAKSDEAMANMEDFSPGDTVRVHFQVIEGGKTRTQVFQGTVLRRRGRHNRETFTVRRLTHGIGVERSFPVQSSRVERVEVVRHGEVRRARLYYLRDRIGRATRVKERRQARPGAGPAPDTGAEVEA